MGPGHGPRLRRRARGPGIPIPAGGALAGRDHCRVSGRQRRPARIGKHARSGRPPPGDPRLVLADDAHARWRGQRLGGVKSFRFADLDGRRVTDRALAKALRSQDPVTLPPGAYPAVLEPSAAADQVGYFLWSLDRRPADEGRSYFSDQEAGTKLGRKLFGDNITIVSDPTDPRVPSRPWGEDGQPLAPTAWVQNGRLQNLTVSRYWAGQKGIAPMPHPSNMIMTGEDQTLDDLIAGTDYGLLVTSFWYIRSVDPQTLLNTGLTRDGLFLIEGGRVTRPVVNFRWNESPAALLGCVEGMSRPERAVGRQSGWPALVPALKVRAFHFSSVSPSS